MSLDFSLEALSWQEIFSINYTHNVAPMWKKAGVYDALYNKEGEEAYTIIKILKAGIKDMIDNAEEYKKLNPKNGWGDYEGALLFLKNILVSCEANPTARISIYK